MAPTINNRIKKRAQKAEQKHINNINRTNPNKQTLQTQQKPINKKRRLNPKETKSPEVLLLEVERNKLLKQIQEAKEAKVLKQIQEEKEKLAKIDPETKLYRKEKDRLAKINEQYKVVLQEKTIHKRILQHVLEDLTKTHKDLLTILDEATKDKLQQREQEIQDELEEREQITEYVVQFRLNRIEKKQEELAKKFQDLSYTQEELRKKHLASESESQKKLIDRQIKGLLLEEGILSAEEVLTNQEILLIKLDAEIERLANKIEEQKKQLKDIYKELQGKLEAREELAESNKWRDIAKQLEESAELQGWEDLEQEALAAQQNHPTMKRKSNEPYQESDNKRKKLITSERGSVNKKLSTKDIKMKNDEQKQIINKESQDITQHSDELSETEKSNLDHNPIPEMYLQPTEESINPNSQHDELDELQRLISTIQESIEGLNIRIKTLQTERQSLEKQLEDKQEESLRRNLEDKLYIQSGKINPLLITRETQLEYLEKIRQQLSTELKDSDRVEYLDVLKELNNYHTQQERIGKYIATIEKNYIDHHSPISYIDHLPRPTLEKFSLQDSLYGFEKAATRSLNAKQIHKEEEKKQIINKESQDITQHSDELSETEKSNLDHNPIPEMYLQPTKKSINPNSQHDALDELGEFEKLEALENKPNIKRKSNEPYQESDNKRQKLTPQQLAREKLHTKFLEQSGKSQSQIAELDRLEILKEKKEELRDKLDKVTQKLPLPLNVVPEETEEELKNFADFEQIEKEIKVLEESLELEALKKPRLPTIYEESPEKSAISQTSNIGELHKRREALKQRNDKRIEKRQKLLAKLKEEQKQSEELTELEGPKKLKQQQEFKMTNDKKNQIKNKRSEDSINPSSKTTENFDAVMQELVDRTTEDIKHQQQGSNPISQETQVKSPYQEGTKPVAAPRSLNAKQAQYNTTAPPKPPRVQQAEVAQGDNSNLGRDIDSDKSNLTSHENTGEMEERPLYGDLPAPQSVEKLQDTVQEAKTTALQYQDNLSEIHQDISNIVPNITAYLSNKGFFTKNKSITDLSNKINSGVNRISSFLSTEIEKLHREQIPQDKIQPLVNLHTSILECSKKIHPKENKKIVQENCNLLVKSLTDLSEEIIKIKDIGSNAAANIGEITLMNNIGPSNHDDNISIDSLMIETLSTDSLDSDLESHAKQSKWQAVINKANKLSPLGKALAMPIAAIMIPVAATLVIAVGTGAMALGGAALTVAALATGVKDIAQTIGHPAAKGLQLKLNSLQDKFLRHGMLGKAAYKLPVKSADLGGIKGLEQAQLEINAKVAKHIDILKQYPNISDKNISDVTELATQNSPHKINNEEKELLSHGKKQKNSKLSSGENNMINARIQSKQNELQNHIKDLSGNDKSLRSELKKFTKLIQKKNQLSEQIQKEKDKLSKLPDKRDAIKAKEDPKLSYDKIKHSVQKYGVKGTIIGAFDKDRKQPLHTEKLKAQHKDNIDTLNKKIKKHSSYKDELEQQNQRTNRTRGNSI